MAAKRKRVTLNEFRSWLEGVEELQADEWAPTKEQWKLIRVKIDSIKEVVKQPEVQQPTLIPQFSIPNAPRPVAGIVPAPEVGGILNSADFTISPEAQKMLGNSADGKHQTPNIDTTDGNFNSAFE